MIRSLKPYVRPDKLIPRGYELASRILRNDGTPGYDLLVGTFLGALDDALKIKWEKWKPKGEPDEYGNNFYNVEIKERLPKLLACGAAIEALEQLQESMYDERTEWPEWAKRPDDKPEGMVIVSTMFFLTMSIWESLPDLEVILRPLRQKGLVPQEVVDELGWVLRDWLRLAEERLLFQSKYLERLDDYLYARGDGANGALRIARDFWDGLRAQVAQLMKPVEVEGSIEP